MNTTAFISFIENHLSQSRIDHSLRVAQAARSLASHYGIDPAIAECAGILHDVAKYLSPEKTQQFTPAFRSNLNQVWETYPLIWHQFAGAEMAEIQFPELETEIIDAIKWHTTGTKNMSPLAQIIYIADYIEPERPFPTRAIIETLAYSDIDQATYGLAYLSLQQLLSAQIPIYPESTECHNFYLSKIGKKNAKVVAHLLTL